ncbi:MAG: aspartyl protease [Planctomycetes bacterium]|nr:aspartyl protease [Planctomycetota bacterium]
MGATTVEVTIRKTHDSRRSRTVEFLVDSGAVYSVVPASTLKELGCKPYREKDFFLADGSKVKRQIGDAYFEYKGVGGPAPVIFGEKRDRNLLGVTTLEALELVLDPFRGELRPMTMNLMGAVPDYSLRTVVRRRQR